MNFSVLLIVTLLFYCVQCKTKTKALTESMGQEIIEIDNPIKEFPPDLEEEPSNETYELLNGTTTTLQPATKKEVKKTALSNNRRKMKDIDKIDGTNIEEDETKVEKDLAEIYKDLADYKDETTTAKATVKTTKVTVEPTKANTTTKADLVNLNISKPIERTRKSFRFQPDLSNKKEVEKFRTSVDEITCDKSVTLKMREDIENSVENTVENTHNASPLLLNFCGAIIMPLAITLLKISLYF